MIKRLRLPLVLPVLFCSLVTQAQKTSRAAQEKTKIAADSTILLPAANQNYTLLFQTQKRKTTTGAVGELPAADLLKTTSASYGGWLTGRLAGLYTTQTSGEPGNDDVNVFVRGQAPMVLVDGTPQSFFSINPEQIESVTVLKDAVSTAMLGMRSGAGALLITTKKGKGVGQKIELTAIHGFQQPTQLPKFLNAFDYARLYNEALVNEGRTAVYTQADLDAYKNGTDPLGHPDVNWKDQVLKNTMPFSRYDLSVSGAGNTARYFVNVDYMHQDGIFKKEDFNVYNTNADYKRYIFRSNVEMDLGKYVTTSLNLFGRLQNTNQPGITNGTILTNLFNTPNNAYPVRNADSSLGGNQDYQSNIYAQTVLSGYQPIYERDFKADINIKANLDALVKGLWVKGLAALNAYQRETINRSKTFAVYKPSVDPVTNAVTYGQYGTKGDQQNSTSINTQNRLFYTELSAGYSTTKNGNSLDALLLFSNDYRMVNSDLPFNYSGVSAKISYNYKQKYLLDVVAGYNGTERFPENNRYGFFPAIGLGWNITNENFMKNKTGWLNELKLRTSFGKTGNANVGYYDYYQYYNNGSGYGFGNTIPSSTTTLQLGTLANPNITWEKADKFSAGIDAVMFKEHLSFSFDYYNDKYTDLVQQRGNGSSILGTAYMRENIGINRYSGVELQASWHGGKNGFSYFVSPNVSVLNTKVIYQAEPYRPFSWNVRTGQQVGQLFGYVAEGLFQSAADVSSHAYQGGGVIAGDIKYKDLNGDGVINAEDQTAIGNTKALIYYGLNTGFTVKGFDFTMLLQGAANRSMYLGGNGYWAFQNNGKAQAYESNLERWTPETAATAKYPRVWIGNNANNTATSSYWVKKGDYLRIKSMELGYSLPQSFIKKAGLTTARFFINATNLVTFTSVEGQDPEAALSAYPIMKTINAGINLKF